MPRFAANLSMLFTELPFLERFGAAAAAGFEGVEWQFAYDVPAQRVREELTRYSLEPVVFNLPAGDWAAGDRGIAGVPDRIEEFRRDVPRALEFAMTVGCRKLHVMAGKEVPGVSRERQLQVFVDNLRHASDVVAGAGVELLIEPINRSVDIPGYLVAGSVEGMEVVGLVARANVRLQYDIYHMQITEGDLARTLERLLPSIGHIQLADNPGRHEPGTGEIAFDWLLERIDALGYTGWIGCEYRPLRRTIDGLSWARRYLRPQR